MTSDQICHKAYQSLKLNLMERRPKILYAIQGTGNGHVSRARDIVPLLQARADLDVLISGIQSDVQLPYPIKYRFYGMSFIFGTHGGVDMRLTARKAKPFLLWQEIKRLPVKAYDLVISDFEPVSSWACKLAKVPCISLSHQAGVMAPDSPQPEKDNFIGRFIMNHYAPFTHDYGFHFANYGPQVYTPVIRQAIRALSPTNDGHYTVYLPSYDDDTLIQLLRQIEGVNWQVFSKHNMQPSVVDNVTIKPVQNEAFIESMASCAGLLCGAGFEAPAEALYLGKKLMVIPMSNQYEQYCNAAGAATLGVPVIWKLDEANLDTVRRWVSSDLKITVDFPDQTADIVDLVLHNHLPTNQGPHLSLAEYLALKH